MLVIILLFLYSILQHSINLSDSLYCWNKTWEKLAALFQKCGVGDFFAPYNVLAFLAPTVTSIFDFAI